MIDIIKMANEIKLNGGMLYLVGGAIRDKLCGICSNDNDYCVVGMSSEKFEKLFKNAYKRGKFFGVYDIEGVEFALARAELKNGIGHTDFNIISNKNITIDQDLKRRDITINSIAQDVLTEKIIDPFNGVQDIKDKIIRATSEHFVEDPLRAYRVARFASKLNFKVDEDTIKMITKMKKELQYISVERVFEEFRKAINSNYPELFFEVLKKSNILDVHFVEIYKLIGALQPIKYHPEGDSYNHTMLALKMATSITKDEKIRFSALVHDLGKGVTPKNEYPHHINHDINGVQQVKNFGKRLKMPNSWVKCGTVAAKEHMKGGIFNKMTTAKKVDFIERISKTLLGLDGLEIVVESDRNCRGNQKEKVEFAELGKKMLKDINGSELMIKYNLTSGIKLKDKLHQERVQQLKKIEDSRSLD